MDKEGKYRTYNLPQTLVWKSLKSAVHIVVYPDMKEEALTGRICTNMDLGTISHKNMVPGQ